MIRRVRKFTPRPRLTEFARKVREVIDEMIAEARAANDQEAERRLHDLLQPRSRP